MSTPNDDMLMVLMGEALFEIFIEQVEGVKPRTHLYGPDSILLPPALTNNNNQQ
jgi:hypothetical protein